MEQGSEAAAAGALRRSYEGPEGTLCKVVVALGVFAGRSRGDSDSRACESGRSEETIAPSWRCFCSDLAGSDVPKRSDSRSLADHHKYRSVDPLGLAFAPWVT